MGARPLKRLIQKNIENELSRLLLSKEVQENQEIKFSLVKNKIVFNITEAGV